MELLAVLTCIACVQVTLGSYLTNIIDEGSETVRLFSRTNQKYDPDVDLTTPNIIRRHGYPAESHVVETEDGYLLTLHRIPYSNKQGASPPLRQTPPGQTPPGQTPPERTTPPPYTTTPPPYTTSTTPPPNTTTTTPPPNTTTTTPPPYTTTPPPPQTTRPVVFLQHGLLASSADWILSGPDKALAYILSDSGYDVWLGNARGNTYSRSHVTLSVSDSAFWDFSFHELGMYDLPAAIDHVLNVTGQSSLYYVGHSMGTTMFYVYASMRPADHLKVKAMFGLAPVAYVDHMKSPIRLLAPWIDDIEFLAHFLGAAEFLPQNKILSFLAKYGCEVTTAEKKICENALFVLCGFDDKQYNETLLPLILGHTPAGTATKVLVHYAQEIRSGAFQQFDHGAKGNMAAYNQSTPPHYDLTLVDIPVALHIGDNDWLASKQDVQSLSSKLPKLIGIYDVPFPSFNHLDFLWGKDAKTLVYDTVLQLMKNMTNFSTAYREG